MTCHNCGRQLQNEAANFCEYCGASFRERVHTAPDGGMGQPFQSRPFNPGTIPNGMPGIQPLKGEEKPTSLLGWLAMYAILLVPMANIILLLIWAFSNITPTGRKNWARATLIFLAFLFILFIGYMVTVMNTPLFQQMMQDYGPYYQ